MRFSLLTVLSVLLVAFAGCAESGGEDKDDKDLKKIEVTDTTGGIRGVVVDTSITPVMDARVFLNTGEETTTDEGGVFTFVGLEPGTYFVTAEKLFFDGAQASTQVVAGVAEPPVLTIQIARLAGVVPYVEVNQFDGFYDCAFAAPFITDSCDMAARTAHDAGATVVPRSLQNNVNTGFIMVSPQVQTIIQEGFYDDSVTSRFWTMVSSTPIDNGCDCSDIDYVDNIGEDGTTYGRGDRSTGEAFPAAEEEEEVAVRGFIPWYTSSDPGVDYALGLEFQIFTTLFYNFEAAEGWNIEARDAYPLPS